MELEELRAEREARIEALERRSRRRDPGVRLPVAIGALVLASVGFAFEGPDIAYFFSSRDPIVLGHEGGYRLERLATNRYVQVHGAPTARGDYAIEHGDVIVVVGLRDTPMLVRRRALATERWEGSGIPPQPDQRSFAVGGRLLCEADATKYRAAFEHFRKMGEVQPRDGKLWLIIEGERPGEDRGVVLITLVLLTFAIANGVFVVRRLRR